MTQHHAALIYTMLTVSASDGTLTEIETRRIGQIIDRLPIFSDFDKDLFPAIVNNFSDLIDSGIEGLVEHIKGQLPEKLYETSYALACDIAAVDHNVSSEESRMLEVFRHVLNIDRLICAAIERGARARHIIL